MFKDAEFLFTAETTPDVTTNLSSTVEKIDDLQEELGDIESEVNKIKFSEKDEEE